MIIKTLGTRGSNFNKGIDYELYGQETTSFYAKSKDSNILVDCGSGVSYIIDDLKQLDKLIILLTHVHFDHIVGILSLISNMPHTKISVYGLGTNGKSLKETLRPFVSMPYWPIDLSECPNVEFIDIFEITKDNTFMLNDVKVSVFESYHTENALIYKLEDETDKVCFAFDFNHKDGNFERLIDFSKNVDLLIYDATYLDKEYIKYSNYGHSTIEKALEIKNKTNASMLVLTHHLYNRCDDELKEIEENYLSSYPDVYFSKELDIYVPHEKKVKHHANQTELLLNIGTLLSAEKNRNKLFDKIIDAALDLTNADAGTLYTLKDNELHFKVMVTRSKGVHLGGDGEKINLPPVKLSKSNVCAACVLEKQLININDVYQETKYDFSGPKKYDALTGYTTRSVMVTPMMNDYGEIIGALQLINAQNDYGEITSFDEHDEKQISALSSQAAICLTNINYSKQIVDLLYGFIGVISTGIDARTPYNANHTKNMVKYASAFLKYEEETDGAYKITKEEQTELLMSIWLHDIGKLIIPLEVMDKATRLGDSYNTVLTRFEKIRILLNLQFAKKELSNEEFENKIKELDEATQIITQANNAGFLKDDVYESINRISKLTYVDLDNQEYPYLTDNELNLLSIRKGTLSAEERKIIESHVVYTYKMLKELTFPKGFENIPFYSGSHHELINGSGYPNHLTNDDIPWKVRLITIIDVFEALTARDRPYKAPMSDERAISILTSMVDEGKLDKDILNEFIKSNCFKQE